jgi:nucleotide-binding universal stress UspA family protein
MYTNILVAFDGSDPARRAFDRAVELARAAKGNITLLYAHDIVQAVPLEIYGLSAPVVRTQELERAKKMLQELAAGVTGVPVDIVVEAGNPPDVIVEQAKARKADLTVIGSRGMRALGRWMLGSVSDRVVHASPNAVLVVH